MLQPAQTDKQPELNSHLEEANTPNSQVGLEDAQTSLNENWRGILDNAHRSNYPKYVASCDTASPFHIIRPFRCIDRTTLLVKTTLLLMSFTQRLDEQYGRLA